MQEVKSSALSYRDTDTLLNHVRLFSSVLDRGSRQVRYYSWVFEVKLIVKNFMAYQYLRGHWRITLQFTHYEHSSVEAIKVLVLWFLCYGSTQGISVS